MVSKVDYCNSVLAGVFTHLLDRLQSVLNIVSRLICSARRSEHISPLVHELQWLRVPERIRFRRCVLAFRCLHGRAPSYLAGSLQRAADVGGLRHLRSASLVVPSTHRSTLATAPFRCVVAVRAWNKLPPTIKTSPSLLTFRTELKIFLFNSSSMTFLTNVQWKEAMHEQWLWGFSCNVI